jgi:hypothetical protein
MQNLKHQFQNHIIDSFNDNDMQNLDNIIKNIKIKQNKMIMGLDAEFYHSNVALLQLSFYNDSSMTGGTAFLIRFYDENKNYHSNIPQSLTNIFIDRNIIKIGVNIGNDIGHILSSFYHNNPNKTNICNLFVNSSFDLQKYYLNSHKGENIPGLLFLSKYYCDVDISSIKTKKITISDWSNYNLSNEQIEYAFFDTIMCLEMAKKINIFEIDNIHNICNQIKIKYPKIRQRCDNDELEITNDITFDDDDSNDMIYNKFIERFYKKYNPNIVRLFFGFEKIKVFDDCLHDNIVTQIKIKNKNGEEILKEIGVMSMHRFKHCFKKKSIFITEGTPDKPIKICYTNYYDEQDIHLEKDENKRKYDFTPFFRPNICFSCCSSHNLYKFRIIPMCIQHLLSNNYKEICHKFGLDSSIFTVPICKNCFWKSFELLYKFGMIIITNITIYLKRNLKYMIFLKHLEH